MSLVTWVPGPMLLFSVSALAEPAPTNPGNSGQQAQAFSIILYAPGPAWKKGLPIAAQGLAAHGKYLAGMRSRGLIALAGPLPSLEGGLVIVCGDANAASKIMKGDPAVLEGKFTGMISDWTPKLGSPPGQCSN